MGPIELRVLVSTSDDAVDLFFDPSDAPACRVRGCAARLYLRAPPTPDLSATAPPASVTTAHAGGCRCGHVFFAGSTTGRCAGGCGWKHFLRSVALMVGNRGTPTWLRKLGSGCYRPLDASESAHRDFIRGPRFLFDKFHSTCRRLPACVTTQGRGSLTRVRADQG